MIDRAQDILDTDNGQSSSTPNEPSPAVNSETTQAPEVVSNVGVTLTDTPTVTEDGISAAPAAAELVTKVEPETFADSSVSAYSQEEALTAPSVNPALIGAHDAHAKVDAHSATLYAPQPPLSEDAAALARAEALHPDDNRPDEEIDAVAEQRVVTAGHGSSLEQQQQRTRDANKRREQRGPKNQPQGQGRQLPPASEESLARLKDFERVRTENSVRNFSKRQAADKAGRQDGKQGPKSAMPHDKKTNAPRQPQVPRAPQVPVLVRSERTVNYLKEAMNERDMSQHDGKTHINTSVEAKTAMGRLLETNAFAPFNHPDLGAFNSLSGLWYYLTGAVNDEAFRELSGSACLRRGSRMETRHVPGLRSIIAEATWFKVTQHEKLGKMMAENNLPFRCYFTRGEGLSRGQRLADIEHWYMPVLDEIGRAMRAFHLEGKEDAAPNFDFLQGMPPTRPAERAPKQREQRQPQQRRERPERQERQG